MSHCYNYFCLDTGSCGWVVRLSECQLYTRGNLKGPRWGRLPLERRYLYSAPALGLARQSAPSLGSNLCPILIAPVLDVIFHLLWPISVCLPRYWVLKWENNFPLYGSINSIISCPALGQVLIFPQNIGIFFLMGVATSLSIIFCYLREKGYRWKHS